MWRFLAVFALGCSSGLILAAGAPEVHLRRLPQGGVQPQAVVDNGGVLHVVYLKGEASQSDVFYIRSSDSGKSFSEPVRVNSQPGSAVAAGAIRGAQIAVGRNGRVYVVWNGSSAARPRGPRNPVMPAGNPHNGAPLLYSRMAGSGGFEPQRNLMTRTFALDGGGSIAADAEGNVYVAWHARAPEAAEGEGGRRVWLAHSPNDGKTFSSERAIFEEPTGACACCGMRLFCGSEGRVLILYRSARETVHRDIYLLASRDRGQTFRGKMVDPWEIGACPMSSMAFAEGPRGLLAAWETAGQVRVASVEPSALETSRPFSPPGEAAQRKHPSLAQSAAGDTLLVWTISKGWRQPPELAWQVFGPDGAPKGPRGRVDEIPVWGFGAAISGPNGGFTVLY